MSKEAFRDGLYLIVALATTWGGVFLMVPR